MFTYISLLGIFHNEKILNISTKIIDALAHSTHSDYNTGITQDLLDQFVKCGHLSLKPHMNLEMNW